MINNNERCIYIVGKNSRLFKSFFNFYNNNSHKKESLVLCSHRDVTTIELPVSKKNLCILFSISSCKSENKALLKQLCELFDEVRIIGSSSIISYCAKNFNYSNIKLNQQENAKELFIKGHKVSCYLFGDFYNSSRLGKKFVSNYKHLEEYIFSKQINDFSNLYAYEKGKNSKICDVIYDLFEMFFGIKLTAAIFKYLTPFTYGYSRIK